MNAVTVKAKWTAPVTNFSYTGKVQSFKVPTTGYYKLEVWGANGGRGIGTNDASYPYRAGGRGGYSYGTIHLSKDTVIYAYVGEAGTENPCTTKKCSTPGTWNGGGRASNRSASERAAPGGGGTDFSIQGTADSTTWNESKHLYSRIIVAGGGGGGDGHGAAGTSGGGGGYGGGTSGSGAGPNRNNNYSYGGTQTSGGAASGWGTGYQNGTAGGFGYGGYSELLASPTTPDSYDSISGGGGGWYGGGGMSYGGAGGGSGYVFTSSTISSYPSGRLVNSSHYLTSAVTLAGNQTFKSPSGTNETGHTGNGYARITWLGTSV